jgi:4-amino-4-deoxy-L-arabinose transferase-like glycosyltransferase
MNGASDAQSARRAMVVPATVLAVILYAAWQAWLVAAARYPAHYEYDEGVYAQTAAAASAGSRLYTAVFLSQPPLFIRILAHAFGTFGSSLGTARDVVVVFSVLWLAALAVIAARASGSRAALWAVAIAASAPAFVAASHTIEMEGPAEAFAALAVALGIAAAAASEGHSGRTGWLAGALWGSAGAAAGLAVMTKFTALTCFVPLAVVLTIADPHRPARTAAACAAPFLGAAALAAIAAQISAGGLSTEMWRQSVAFHGAVARATPLDLRRTASLLAGFAAVNWFVTALALAGAASALAWWRRGPRAPHRTEREHHIYAVTCRAIAAWLVADIAALVLWRPVWPHHFAILLTPLIVLAAAAVEMLWRRGPGAAAAAIFAPSRRTSLAITGGTVMAAWLLALITTITAARPAVSQAVRAAATQTRLAVPPAAQVVTDDPFIAFLAGRQVPPQLCDTSEMRMRTGWLTVSALNASLAEPRVGGVVLWRGTFRRMAPQFVAGAEKQFPRRVSLTADGEILAR